MGKLCQIFCTAAILNSSFVLYTSAEETDQVNVIEQTNEETAENEETEEVSQLEEVKELTLEGILERGIENDKNLTVLKLNLEATKNQLLDTEDSKRDVTGDIRELKNKLDDLKDQKDRIKSTSPGSYSQTWNSYQDSLDSLEEQISSLEISIKKLEVGELQLQLEEEEAKEGVRLALTSAYTDILSLQSQIEYTKLLLQSAMNDVTKTQRLYELGGATKEEVRSVQVAQADIQEQLTEQEREYEHTLAQLCFDIGIIYDPEITIKSIELDAVEVEKPENYEVLITNTFKMKNAQKDLETMMLDRDEMYNDEDATTYAKEQYDYKVKAAEETLSATKTDLETTVKQLYYDAEQSYLSYKESLRQLESVKADIQVLQKRYNLGGISKYEYEKELIALKEAELDVFLGKVENYNIQQSISALKNGYLE